MTEEEISKIVKDAYTDLVNGINTQYKTEPEQNQALLDALAPYSDDEGLFDFDKFKAHVLADHAANEAAITAFDPSKIAAIVDAKVSAGLSAEDLPQVRVAPSLREQIAQDKLAVASRYLSRLADRLEAEIAEAAKDLPKMAKEFGSYGKLGKTFADASLGCVTRQDVWEMPGYKRLLEVCERLDMCLEHPEHNLFDFRNYTQSSIKIFIERPYADSPYLKYKKRQLEKYVAANMPGRLRCFFSKGARQTRKELQARLAAPAAANALTP